MSRYADSADVQAHVPQRRFAAQTTPNIEDVLRSCDNRSAELDGAMLDQGIAAPLDPVVSPFAYAWARAAVAYGAAMDAESAGFPGQSDSGETPRLAFLRRQWERMLADLQAGRVRLSDAPRIDATASQAGFRSGPVTDETGPWFGRGQAHVGGDGPRTHLP